MKCKERLKGDVRQTTRRVYGKHLCYFPHDILIQQCLMLWLLCVWGEVLSSHQATLNFLVCLNFNKGLHEVNTPYQCRLRLSRNNPDIQVERLQNALPASYCLPCAVSTLHNLWSQTSEWNFPTERPPLQGHAACWWAAKASLWLSYLLLLLLTSEAWKREKKGSMKVSDGLSRWGRRGGGGGFI